MKLDFDHFLVYELDMNFEGGWGWRKPDDVDDDDDVNSDDDDDADDASEGGKIMNSWRFGLEGNK